MGIFEQLRNFSPSWIDLVRVKDLITKILCSLWNYFNYFQLTSHQSTDIFELVRNFYRLGELFLVRVMGQITKICNHCG